MTRQTIFAIGTEAEIAHHVAPFADQFAVQIVTPERALTLARPSDLAIFYSEHFDRFRHACVELKRRNVATLYMLDGILEWRNAFENRPTEPACPWTMRTVLSHKVACIGTNQQRILDLWGNHGKTEVVGIPRLESECSRFISATDDTTQLEIKPRSDKFRLLVATAKTPGFTDDQLAVTRRSLEELKAFTLQNPTTPDGRMLEVVWRVNAELAEQLKIENACCDTTGIELAEQLDAIDAVVTTPSTLMLEGMLRRIPVALLNFHHSPLLNMTPWVIQHANQFPEILAELCTPSAAKIELQCWLLRDSLYCETNSVHRMIELIEGLLLSTREQVAAGQHLGFPAAILPPPKTAVGHFPLARVYPQFPEWGLDSPQQIAGELAQSRREISHLQRELAQAKSELSTAHQIFEEIRRHPIAGPIVRIRESLLSFFKSSRQNAKPTEQPLPETKSELAENFSDATR